MAIRRRFGAQFQGNGRTCFGLWAPDAREVRVETADGRDWPLEGSDSGWFEATLPCPPGTRYRYRIDGRPGVPDPASQFQPDGVHGHSQVLDHGAYAWRVDEWHGRPWHEAVIYELHVGLFGSYAEVERFLPRLVELGVTAVELMPLGEFPGRRNWGYDGVLPFAPASAYGTPEQLKHLIDSAHGMGLMVFVDVIYNHFGPDGNYLAQYAAAFFRDDRQTPWGQAIDFRRGEVREFFYENALMWLLDYRVDGLRFDAVHAIPDSAFLVEMARRLRGAAGPERHVHLVLENDDNRASLLRQGYDAQWNDDGHHALHVLLTGENDGYYQDYPEPLRCLARCLAEGFVYQGEANRHGRPRGEPSADLAPDAFVLFLQNHDQVGNRAFGERLSVLAEPQTLRLAIALQLLAPMIPLLFMGEECAAREPFLYFTDHQGELADAVREGRCLSLDDDDDDEPSLGKRRHGLSALDEDDEESAEEQSVAPLGSARKPDEAPVESLDQLRDEPLQLAWEKPRRQWPRRLGWLLLILLALGGLAAQYIAYHFDELARQDAYRPWFAQLCPEIGCTLPSKVDVEQIRSSNLVVRSHPEFSGALVVDAIIYNRASFSQPFPLLELRFADLNGHLIANRRFKPGEYLGGELAGRTEMPPQVPIHVSLDILDPGPKAVNYSLSFHSPE